MPPHPPASAIIHVIGSLNMDLVTVTPRVPGPGETVNATSFSTGFGGKGANQAVAAARLSRQGPNSLPDPSVQIHMIGAVGDDRFGSDLVAHLAQSERINIDGVVVKKGSKTGVSVITVEEETGENRIMFTKGANGLLEPADVRLGASHDGQKRYAVFQLETPLQTVAECIKRAKGSGSEIVLNPAPAVPLPDDLYPYLDHLIVNESEAALLSGVPEEKLGDSLDSVAESFLSKGVKTVVITLGAKGAYFRQSSGQGHVVPGHVVKSVDTTAAGDTAVGAYVVHLAKYGSHDVGGAIAFANRAAARSVQKEGAQSSMPYLGELVG